MKYDSSEKSAYVYILASHRNGTLYVGVTNDVKRRTFEHKTKANEGFTQKYGVDMLVYYESCSDIVAAIRKEKQLKKWKRSWKTRLIETLNPEWRDLYDEL